MLIRLKNSAQKVNYAILNSVFKKFEEKFKWELFVGRGTNNRRLNRSIFYSIQCRYFAHKKIFFTYQQNVISPFLDKKNAMMMKLKLIKIEKDITLLNRQRDLHEELFKKINKKIKLTLNRIDRCKYTSQCFLNREKLEFLQSSYAALQQNFILNQRSAWQLSRQIDGISAEVEKIIANSIVIDRVETFIILLFSGIDLARSGGKGIKSFKKTGTLALLKNSALVKLKA
ncbi:MAG: hypothetical protein GY821_06970 [Gammaproteobacteria bacterium]|nr:hypothetical protein [Gammaproteobacteria bacterium]